MDESPNSGKGPFVHKVQIEVVHESKANTMGEQKKTLDVGVGTKNKPALSTQEKAVYKKKKHYSNKKEDQDEPIITVSENEPRIVEKKTVTWQEDTVRPEMYKTSIESIIENRKDIKGSELGRKENSELGETGEEGECAVVEVCAVQEDNGNRCGCTMCKIQEECGKDRRTVFRKWKEGIQGMVSMIHNHGWPIGMRDQKILVGIVVDSKEGGNVQKLQLRSVRLRECRVECTEEETALQVIANKQAMLRLLCGITSTLNLECALEKEINVRMVTEARNLIEVKRSTPLDTTYINCTNEEAIIPIYKLMVNSTYEPAPREWVVLMERVRESTEVLFGPQLEICEASTPTLTRLDALLCPVTTSMSAQMQEQLMQTEMGSGNQDFETYTCYAVTQIEDGKQVTKTQIVDTGQSRSAKDVTEESSILRMLLWNIENTAMAFDLQGAIAKRSVIKKRSGPPRENVWEAWMLIAKHSEAHVLVYTEASLPLFDIGKRKRGDSLKITEELEELHREAGYNLYISYSKSGKAQFGQMIAVKIGIKILSVVHGFGPEDGNEDPDGRVTHVEIAMEPVMYRKESVSSFMLTGWYMNNSDDGKREKQHRQYNMFMEDYKGPRIVAADSNCVRDLNADVQLHQMVNGKNKVEVKDTLNLKTGEVIPDKGLSNMQMFKTGRWEQFERFMQDNQLVDAQEVADEGESGIRRHTCHWPWAHWATYAEKRFRGKQQSSIAPMFTAEIDRVLVPNDVKVRKAKVLNQAMENERHRNEIAQITQSLFSDHFVVFVEIELPSPMMRDRDHPFNNYKNIRSALQPKPQLVKSAPDMWLAELRRACVEQEIYFSICEEGIEGTKELNGEHQCTEERKALTKEQKLSRKWRNKTRKFAELMVALKKLKKAYQEAGTLESVSEVMGWVGATTPEEEEDGFINSIAGINAAEVLEEVMVTATEYAIRNQDSERKKGPVGEPKDEECRGYMNNSRALIPKSFVTNQSRKVKKAMKGRNRLRALGILHTVASLHSTRGSDSREYQYFRRWEHRKESTNKLVVLISKCQMFRRSKLEDAVLEEVIQETDHEAQQVAVQESDNLFSSHVPAKRISGGGWLCVPGYLTKEANEQVNEIKSGKLSIADQEIQWVECIDQVIRQTEAESTTRIQGHVALTRDTRMEPESAYQFAGSMLIDTGCSFTIVGYSFFEEYCKTMETTIEREMILYPDYYQPPCASVAKKGCAVYGVGFVRLRLRLLTISKETTLGWNTHLSSQDDQTEITEIQIWAHVFKNINTSILLGMPFVYRYVRSMVFSEEHHNGNHGEDQGSIVLKLTKGPDRKIPMIAPEGRSTHPIMLCLKEDVKLKGLKKETVEVYPVGQHTFTSFASFSKGRDKIDNKWCFDTPALSRGRTSRHPMRYNIEPIQHYSTIFKGGFVTEGVHTELTAQQVGNPKVRIQAIVEEEMVKRIPGEQMPGITREIIEAVIPAGTAVALISQKCYGIETWRYEEHNLDPDEIREKMPIDEEEVCVVVPTPEVQAECEPYTEGWMHYIYEVESAYERRMLEHEKRLKEIQDTNGRTKEGEIQGILGTLSKDLDIQGAMATLQEAAELTSTIEESDQLAKIITQMMWMTRERGAINGIAEMHKDVRKMIRKQGIEHLQEHMHDARKKANKDITEALRNELQGRSCWRTWLYENRTSPAVAMLNADLGMQVDSGSVHVAECCRLERGNLQDRMVEATQRAEADKEMDLLVKMLQTDTAVGSDQFGQVMEQPVSITPFFQETEDVVQEEEKLRTKYYEKVPAQQVLQRMSEKWREKIMKTASSDEAARRLAAYMCQVDVGERNQEQQVLLFERLLKPSMSKFFNINPTDPPRFKGAPFDWVRLREGESKITHQERRVPPAALPAVLKQIQEWIQTGVVEKSKSPHSSPLLLVKKKPLAAPLLPDGSKDTSYVPKVRWRTCVDYVQLNRKSEETDISNAPRVEELLEYIGNAGLGEPATDEEGNPQEYWVSTVDLYSGFNQWMLSEEVKPLTAFTVPGLASEEGRLQFRVLPFGLASAPTRFNTLVAECLGDIRFGSTGNNRKTCTNYIDDVYVAGVCTYEQHLDDLEECFGRLQNDGFAARMDKAEFVRHEISMLGWTIAKGTKSIQKDKLEKIDNIVEKCESVKDVMTALGTIGFYRQLIPMCGDIEAPLYDLTRKGAWHDKAWTPIHTACMRLLKHSLRKEMLLALPRIGPEFPPMKLATDASNYAGGACLSQEQPDGVERPICYASKTFTKEQRNWAASERELWTLMYFATEHFKHYLQGEFVLFTDHKPLTHLFKERGTINPKLARWAARLSRIRAKVEYRCGTVMGPADLFSRLLKDRPTREEQQQETPDIRKPIVMPRGALQEFENVDTTVKGISLNRAAGLPQQRVAFLRGKDKERESSNGDPEEEGVLTAELYKKLEQYKPEVAERLSLISKEATRETGKTPVFEIARVRNVLNAERGVTSETERVQQRKEEESSVRINVEEDDDYSDTDEGELEATFPEKLVAWTTVREKEMSEIFRDATGEEVEYEEEEIICAVEKHAKQQGMINEVQSTVAKMKEDIVKGPKSWLAVREAVTQITQERICKIHGCEARLSKSQNTWIEKLTDPRKTVIVCQGGAGSGKTYTAMLTACVATEMGLLAKVKHSKPLVSTGGSGLGFERGTMADKLKYWCAPAREAMERIDMQEVHRAKVESFPIDRTRGVSVPCEEWMIFDEMQNASKSLFKAAMTRAETGGKVILCGDIEQEDCGSQKNKNGMRAFLQKWDSVEEKKSTGVEEATLKRQLETTVAVIELKGPMMREKGIGDLNKFMETMSVEGGRLYTQRPDEYPKKSMYKKVTTLAKEIAKDKTRREIESSEHAQALKQSKSIAPVFASFAGMDMLGMGMKESFPQMRCVGASERNGVARKVFARQHGFQPFGMHDKVPDYVYEGVFMVTSGAPCVAFSYAGKQSGSSDKRGTHYVEQAHQYTKARVPVIVLEQVPQARDILPKDAVSRGARKSPHQRVATILEEGGYHVPRGPDGCHGMIINAAHQGGVMDRERLITIAVRQDLWDLQGHLFEWPTNQ